MRKCMLLFGLMAAPMLWAQTYDVSLKDAMAKALENNFALQRARNSVSAAKWANHIGEAGMLPTLGYTFNGNSRLEDIDLKFLNGEQVSQDNARGYTVGHNLRLDWIVFDGLNMFAQKNMLNIREALADMQLRVEVENTLEQIINTYYRTLLLAKTLEVYEENIALSKQRFDLIEHRYRLGMSNEVERLQALNDLYADSTLYKRQGQMLYQEQLNLQYLMGDAEGTELPMPSDEIDGPADMAYSQLFTAMQEENQTLKTLRAQEMLSRKELKSNQSSFMPQVGVFGEYNINRQVNEVGFLAELNNRGSIIGVGIRWNLFDGFRDYRRNKVLELEIENARIDIAETQALNRKAFLEAQNIHITEQQVWRMEKSNLENLEKNYEIAFKRYERGLIIELELRELQRGLIQSKVRTYEALYYIIGAETTMLRLSGALMP